MQESIICFEKCSQRLLAAVQGREPETVEEVRGFIEGCKYNQTANIMWRWVLS